MKAHLREVRAEDEDGKIKVMSSIKLSKTTKKKCLFASVSIVYIHHLH